MTNRIIWICLIGVAVVLGLSCSAKRFFYSDDGEISLKHLLATAVRAAEIGGREIVRTRENPEHIGQNLRRTEEAINDVINRCTLERSDDLVKEADRKSLCAMSAFLKSVLRGSGVALVADDKNGERCEPTGTPPDLDEAAKTIEDLEIGDELVRTSDVTIWVEPLDASKAFATNRLPCVTTMVCVAVKGVPTIGVIHKPFTGQTYWGSAGVEHRVSDNLKNATPPSRNERKMIVERSMLNDVRQVMNTHFPGMDIQSIPSSGVGHGIAEIALGKIRGFVHLSPINKWDICAGAAILRSHGGTMINIHGELMNDFNVGNSTLQEGGALGALFDIQHQYTKFKKMFEDGVRFG